MYRPSVSLLKVVLASGHGSIWYCMGNCGERMPAFPFLFLNNMSAYKWMKIKSTSNNSELAEMETEIDMIRLCEKKHVNPMPLTFLMCLHSQLETLKLSLSTYIDFPVT